MTYMRTPSVADAPALAELGRTSFVETFGHLYKAEDLNAFLDQAYGLRAVAGDLIDSTRLLRVIEAQGRMVGYCKLGLGVSLDFDLKGRRSMELKQLYLRQSHLGSGGATLLMDWALAEARQRRYEMVVLSVWSGNERAQRFYQRHGFAHIGNTHFMVGNHRDDEFVYGLDLTTTDVAA